MDEHGIRTALEMMGVSRIKVSGSQVNATCPLAKWTHNKGKDSRPSFSVHVAGSEISKCHCFTCDAKGKFSNIAYRYMEFTGEGSVFDYIKGLESVGWRKERSFDESRRRGVIEELGGYSHASEMKKREDIRLKPEEVAVVEKYLKVTTKYAFERGIDKSALKEFNVGYYPGGEELFQFSVEKERLKNFGWMRGTLFPVYNLTNEMIGWSLKPFTGDLKYFHRTGFKKERMLYGMHLFDKKKGPPVIVEGHFDVLSTYQAGFNACGLFGKTLSGFQEEIVVSLAEEFGEAIVMLDGDKYGIDGAKKIVDVLGKRLKRIRSVLIPDGRDPGNFSRDKEALAKLIHGAAVCPPTA